MPKKAPVETPDESILVTAAKAIGTAVARPSPSIITTSKIQLTFRAPRRSGSPYSVGSGTR